MNIPPPFQNQINTTNHILKNQHALVLDDPGTGKTRAAIDAISHLIGSQQIHAALVLAPKTILRASWSDDLDRFAPHLTYVVAQAENRLKAFMEDVHIYITNHDAITWLARNKALLNKIDMLVVDESTAFKHMNSARSSALRTLAPSFKRRVLMTGSFVTTSILDAWHQALVLDGGDRLGRSYYKFREVVCEPIFSSSPLHPKWQAKPGSYEAVTDILRDVSIRHVFEDCQDIPANSVHLVHYELPPKLRKHYDDMLRMELLQLNDKQVITAAHAGAVANKLLQIASGNIYDEAHQGHQLDNSRTELIFDLIEEREQSVVAFLWSHQRAQLEQEAKRRHIKFRTIAGDVSSEDREQAVKEFQNGDIRIILAHPASASHGLTLTKGTTTIWASPTYNAEHYHQFNRRIYRAGQTQRTQTIQIAARDTIDEIVYNDRLQAKLDMIDIIQKLISAQP